MQVVYRQQCPRKSVQTAVSLQNGQTVHAAVLRGDHQEGDGQLHQEGQVAQVQEHAHQRSVRAEEQRVDQEDQQNGTTSGQLREGTE